MAVTVNINNLSLCHKDSDGVATATIPDVCKTPPGPVPVPYPNVALSKHLKKGTKTIKVDGGNMAANKGSEFSQSIGDEPGVAGGVKSGTKGKEATWLTYSPDVKLEGKNAGRLTDKMLMNHGNTVCMGGEIQNALDVDDEAFKKVCEDCTKIAKLSIKSDEILQREYRKTIGDPNIFTISEMQDAVKDSLKRKGYKVSIQGTSDGKHSEVKPPSGPCGKLTYLKAVIHEQVHKDRGTKLANMHGKHGSPNWKIAWNKAQGPDGAAADEVKAHGFGQEVMRRFLQQECWNVQKGGCMVPIVILISTLIFGCF